MLKLACHDERKAFPVGLVDDDEEPEFAAVVGPSLDEIVGSDARRDGLRGVRRRPCDRRRRGRQGPCRLSGLRPLALGCGGTKPTASGTSITDETVWKSNGGGAGGGVSGPFPLPAYQKGVGVPASAAKAGGRGVPDIAGDADPDSGYRIVTGGQTGIIGGTSAVAPLWAGIVAGIVAGLNAKRGSPLGQIHAALYGDPSALRDIVSGENKSGSIGFSAATGWDARTGLGSPVGKKLVKTSGTANGG